MPTTDCTFRLKTTNLHSLFFDILAGITVVLTLIPQDLAYAGLANVPPVYGLYNLKLESELTT